MTHSSRRSRSLPITRAQCVYLVELIEDDLANTGDLTSDERAAAEALLGKARNTETKFD